MNAPGLWRSAGPESWTSKRAQLRRLSRATPAGFASNAAGADTILIQQSPTWAVRRFMEHSANTLWASEHTPLPPGLTIDDGAMLRSGARSFHSSSTDQLRHLGLNQTRSKIFHLVGLLCRTHKQGEAALKLFETSYTLDPTPRRLAYFEKQKLQCISKKWVRLGPAEKATGLIRVVRAVIDLAHQHAFTILDRYVFRSLLPRRRSQR